MAKFNKLNFLIIPALFTFTSCSKVASNLSENDVKDFIKAHYKEDNLVKPNEKSVGLWEITKGEDGPKAAIGQLINGSTGGPVEELKNKKGVQIKDEALEEDVKELSEFKKEEPYPRIFLAMNETYFGYLLHNSEQGSTAYTLQYHRNGTNGLKITATYNDDTAKKIISYTHIYDSKGRETQFKFDYYSNVEDEDKETYTVTLKFKYNK